MENDFDFDDMPENDQLLLLERRTASLDSNYIVITTSKAFTDYFGNSRCDRLTDFIHPDEADSFNAFLDSYEGNRESQVFRFKNAEGQFRLNLVKLLQSQKNYNPTGINISMTDIESAYCANEKLMDNMLQTKALLGITGEYVFTYNRDTNIFCLYRYELYSREIIFRMDVDVWKKRMLDNDYIAEADKSKFISMCGDMKAYAQKFSAKLSTGIRTRNEVKETLRFNGVLYHTDKDNFVMGRISDENDSGHKRTVEMIDGLTFDPLTHTYNKKAITDYTKRLLAEERNNKVTLVILDVDHFKPVNDTYGHLYGDKVLERVGEKLKEVVGEDGTVGRIGGDEFMVVLNGINDNQLLRGMLRAIRTQIKWEFVNDFDDLTITCSIGAAICPDNGIGYEELFKKADYCLYIAKEKGRDRYVFFRDELHEKAYEESVKKNKTVVSPGREMRELRVMSDIMSKFCIDKRTAVTELMQHMVDTFKLDSLNVFMGEGLRRVETYGTVLNYCDDAEYVNTEEFKKLIGNNRFAQIGFVGNHINDAPNFSSIMRQRRVFSTIQCVIGDGDNIRGLVTLDRCKESAQWADYEVECAVMLASLLTLTGTTDNYQL